MKIPKKITPDFLKDTIVQVVFNPKCAPELVLGRFEQALNKTLEFKAGRPTKKELKISEGKDVILEQLQGGFFLDASGHIKVNVDPGTIVFNNLNEYIGWEKYFPLIKETIIQAFEHDIIESVNRIGIRYISQFDNLSVFENIKMNISLDLPNRDLTKTQFRTEFKEGQFTIIITLLNRLQQKPSEKEDENLISIFDVDVVQFVDRINDPESILKKIVEGHFQQKVSFFSLLKPEFLDSLNPVY